MGNRAVLLFDGIGASAAVLIPRLREYAATPRLAEFVEVAVGEVERAVEYGVETGAPDRFRGLDLRGWMRGGPVQAQAENSVAAGLMALICQLCLLQPQVRRAEAGPREDVAALGHSLGLQAAIVAALDTRRADEFTEAATRALRLLTLTLLRVHQVAAEPEYSESQRRYRAAQPDAPRPGPMASLAGVTRDEALRLVGEHERRLAASSAPGAGEPNSGPRPGSRAIPLCLGLVNSPRMQTLTGLTDDLLDVHFAMPPNYPAVPESGRSEPARRRAVWAFVLSTAPFHNPGLAPAMDLIEKDLAFIGPGVAGSALRLPVFATDGSGTLLARHEDPALEAIRQSVVEVLDWPSVVEHAVRECRPDTLVDFGPGVGAVAFTRDCLRHSGLRLRTVSALHPH